MLGWIYNHEDAKKAKRNIVSTPFSLRVLRVFAVCADLHRFESMAETTIKAVEELMTEFERSIECQVGRDFAWKFWTNVDNWAVVDPGVEWAKLEGPFIAGTKGRTKPRGADPNEWKLTEVEEGIRAVIEIVAPGATVKFHWSFADMTGEGARITQKVTLEGERAAEYEEGMRMLEKGIQSGMERLIEAMVTAARG